MDLNNKVCLITGATSGIGKETAKAFAARGAKLVLPVRDSLKADILKDEILEQTPGADLKFMHCNLASFQSVRDFAREFQQNYSQLHVLINNAGIWETRRNLSDDGVEMMFAVNHLATFLLTNLLLGTMKKSAPARIINVSSNAHRQSKIYFEDIEFEKNFSSLKAYAQSKLANILFTRKLAQVLQDSGVTANSLHPGFVSTKLFEKMPGFLVALLSPFMISPKKGAQTTIYLATSPDVKEVSGSYFVKSKPQKPSSEAMKQDIADQLWQISENYVGI